MRTKIIVISLSLIVICAVTVGVLLEDQQADIAENIEALSVYPAQDERQWAGSVLEPVPLHSDLQDSLFNPMILKSFGSHLYVGGYGDMKIRRFSPEGKFVNEIGIGRGPGEFTQFMDFYVAGDTIYVLDLRKWMVIQFNVNTNAHIRSFKLDFNPMRICRVKNELVIHGIGGSELFNVYDRSGEKLNRFGKLMEDQIAHPLSLQGDLVSTSTESAFIFVPSFASYLFTIAWEAK